MKNLQVGNLVRIDPECPQSHSAKFLVANGYWIRRSPFSIDLETCAEEIHIRLEWRFEELVPILKIGQDGQGFRRQRIQTRPELIRNLPLINEESLLRLTHRELGSVLDLEVLHRKSVRQHPIHIFGVLDDVDELLSNEAT